MAEALALAAGDRRNYADRIVAIAPDHAEAVSSFFLDRAEVTNEQFRRWLDAAHLPPSKGLVDLAWNKVERGTRVEGIPAGEERLPVRAVSFDEAKRAARFAGKRLPTEREWEHAARRRLAPGSWYPWGQGWKAWDARRCANFESTSRSNRGPAPQVAGSFPADVSTDGVLDLCGNVAEWTDATFDPYPGFVAPVIDDRGRKWRASPPFSSLQRVVRGGSAFGNEVTNNLVMRVGEFPGTVLEGVGFRGALSVLPGVDVLGDAIDELGAKTSGLRSSLDLGEYSVAGQTIHFADPVTGASDRAQHLVFARVRELKERMAELRRAARDKDAEGALVGIFATSQDALDPPLPAGCYVVRFEASPNGEGERLQFVDRERKTVASTPVDVVDHAPFATRLSIEPGDQARIVFGLRTPNRGVQPEMSFEIAYPPGTWEPLPPR